MAPRPFAVLVILLLHVLAPGAFAEDRSRSASRIVSDDERLAAWKELPEAEADALTRRHLRGLMRAVHAYHEKHEALPPAIVANPTLPAGKRLSGWVLVLPFIGKAASYEGPTNDFDPETLDAVRESSRRIDLTKAWDDPVNRPVAKLVIPGLLSPRSGPIRNEQGDAVTHFAFVRGSDKGYDGAFPGTESIKISDITDGTVATLGIGQIATDLGPWTAEGLSTSRQLHLPTKDMPGTFGSTDRGSAWFITCDGFPRCLRLDQPASLHLQNMATRAGGEIEAGADILCRKP